MLLIEQIERLATAFLFWTPFLNCMHSWDLQIIVRFPHCLRNNFHQRFHGHESGGFSPNLVDPHMCNHRNERVRYYMKTYINLILIK